MAKTKNVHAVALGKKGGGARTPKQLAALKLGAQFAGRKPSYQIEQAGSLLYFKSRDGEAWATVQAFTPAMLIYLGTWLREHKPRVTITAIQDGTIHLAR